MMHRPKHGYPFDPSYGYELDDLLRVISPEPPDDFEAFWKARYERAREQVPAAKLTPVRGTDQAQVHDLTYQSTDGVTIRGWAVTPRSGEVRRGFVCGHGYGGSAAPDLSLPFDDAVLFFPSLRGLARSRLPGVSPEPCWHVLHHIEDRHRYIHGGCVEDVWCAVSAMLERFPEVDGRVGLLGISFGGGIGMMAAPWDSRLWRAHFEVPSFGNQPLRIQLPTAGSGAAVIKMHRKHPGILDTLAYYDAAVAARFARIPIQIAAATFDPFVAPPGQFSVFNSLPGDRSLCVLEAGHIDYPKQDEDRRKVLGQLSSFFS